MLMDTNHPVHPQDEHDLHVTAPADGRSAKRLRRQLAEWLELNLNIDEERCFDMVLAVYEALANCADHAYRTRGHPGEMAMHVSYDIDTATVQICVEDKGCWVDPDGQPTTRGRGFLLMRALATDVSVNGRKDGTTICLHFDRCPRRPAA